MRSIETLVREFPNLTGHKILEIQKQDKLEDEKEFQKEHQKDLDIIKDINENGGYYRGRFGVDQYFYYNFFNVILENNVIYCDCEHLTLFSGEGKQAVTDNFTLEIRTEQYKTLENYGINFYERVTKKEWDEIVNYFKKTPTKFWKR